MSALTGEMQRLRLGPQCVSSLANRNSHKAAAAAVVVVVAGGGAGDGGVTFKDLFAAFIPPGWLFLANPQMNTCGHPNFRVNVCVCVYLTLSLSLGLSSVSVYLFLCFPLCCHDWFFRLRSRALLCSEFPNDHFNLGNLCQLFAIIMQGPSPVFWSAAHKFEKLELFRLWESPGQLEF